MNEYYKSIKVEKIDVRKFKLLEDIEIFGVKIPKGYITNGSSVPRIFWFVLSPFTEGFRAAIVHDYRYSHNGITRYQADKEFFHNLNKCEVNIIRRSIAFVAVRLFGWLAWEK
jgi:hypothetical protein